LACSQRNEKKGFGSCPKSCQSYLPVIAFTAESTEMLFGWFPLAQFPQMAEWWAHVRQRYPWVVL